MSPPPEKKKRTEDYILYYWPGIPGRGEYIRLALEYAGITYTDHTSGKVLDLLSTPSSASSSSPIGTFPHFAPPALQLPTGQIISQTAAILAHIAPRCGLAGALGNQLNTSTPAGRAALRALSDDDLERAEEERSAVSQLTLTALDWQTEAHDVHHPVAASLYYEDQKGAAAQAAEIFRQTRIPRFLEYYESVLALNPVTSGTDTAQSYLVGKQTTAADLVLFQVVDGLLFAFPKRLGQLRTSEKYDKVFALYERVKGEKGIKEYLSSGRRKKYSCGIFRYYEELDGEENE